MLGPSVFGLPDGFALDPISASVFGVSYERGRIEAGRDVKDGKLALEAFGLGTITPGAPNFSNEAVEQCGFEINHVAACVVDTKILDT